LPIWRRDVASETFEDPETEAAASSPQIMGLSRRGARAELGGAVGGGIVAIAAFFVLVVGVGRVGDLQALSVIEAVLPTTRFLASAAIAAGATILALLLTLLGLSLTEDFSFDPRLYSRARYVAILGVVVIVLGVSLLLAVTVPLAEVDELSRFYDILYYILAGAISLLGGVLVSLGLMISATLIGLIDAFHPEWSSSLRRRQDSERE
jgi:hypothetical protein